MKLSLGLDLGTTTTSAVAVREDGTVAASVTRANNADVKDSAKFVAGAAHQFPDQHFETAIRLLRELAVQIDGSPCCLGLTGQMHGGMLLGATRSPLTPLITWQDRAATVVRRDGMTDLEAFRSDCSDADIAKTGCHPAAGYLGVTLRSLQRLSLAELPISLPGIIANARWAVVLADWIAAEFCAQAPVTDRSNAASTGLYNLRDDCWSDGLIAAAGIERSLLPDVRESGEVIGDLAPEIAARTGLPAGLPVCNAIGDNQAAVLGSVPAGEAAMQINIGTGGQINWPVAEFVRVEGMDTRYLPLGRYMLVGAGTAGGAAYTWVRQTAESWLRALDGGQRSEVGGRNSEFDLQSSPTSDLRPPTSDLYERLNALAAAVPDDADGLVCEPFFRGTRRRPDARGMFRGVDESNFTPGHVARAVLNGIAAALHSFYDSAGEQRPATVTRIIGSGNGLRKNRLLVETLARVFQREVWLPAHREEAAYGTALLAGSQTGVWRNLEAAGACIRLERAV
jgi:sugar (pentulose or hexulose) kinase